MRNEKNLILRRKQEAKNLISIPLRKKHSFFYKYTFHNLFEKYYEVIDDLLKTKNGYNRFEQLFNVIMNEREELGDASLENLKTGKLSKAEVKEQLEFHKYLLKKLLLSSQLISKLNLNLSTAKRFLKEERSSFYFLSSSILLVKNIEELSSYLSEHWINVKFDKDYYLEKLREEKISPSDFLKLIELKEYGIFPLYIEEETSRNMEGRLFLLPFSRIQKVGNFTFYDSSSSLVEILAFKDVREHFSDLPPLRALTLENRGESLIAYKKINGKKGRKNIDKNLFKIYYMHEAMHLIQNSFAFIKKEFNRELLPYSFIISFFEQEQAMKFFYDKRELLSSLRKKTKKFTEYFDEALNAMDIILKLLPKEGHKKLFYTLWKETFGFEFDKIKEIENYEFKKTEKGLDLYKVS